MAPPIKPFPERFWAKVNRLTDADACWLWTGAARSNGAGLFYGVIGEGGRGGKSLSAHRASYELHNGPIPEDLMIRHTCDTSLCVNPSHLVVGTHQQNMDDRTERGRGRALKGEKQPNANLTEHQAKEILALSGRGVSTTSILSLVPVARAQVNRIISGRGWSHLQEAK